MEWLKFGSLAVGGINSITLPNCLQLTIGRYSLDGRIEIVTSHHLRETYINRHDLPYVGLADSHHNRLVYWLPSLMEITWERYNRLPNACKERKKTIYNVLTYVYSHCGNLCIHPSYNWYYKLCFSCSFECATGHRFLQCVSV